MPRKHRLNSQMYVYRGCKSLLLYLAALALEVLHAFQLVHGAEPDDLLTLEVESGARHAALLLATAGDDVVHAL